ncbi:MAG: FmdB family zinc ribbon protein [Anaerolineae bacterium]
MPIYEYHCDDCDRDFQKLRPMSQASAPTPCVHCGGQHTLRALSLFAAISKSSNGESRSVSGTASGCASCAATSCATCSH